MIITYLLVSNICDRGQRGAGYQASISHIIHYTIRHAFRKPVRNQVTTALSKALHTIAVSARPSVNFNRDHFDISNLRRRAVRRHLPPPRQSDRGRRKKRFRAIWARRHGRTPPRG
ncbi:hypothetical protein BGLA2_60105 [Burkholderia gladioli]|nr:hypothetical protein BGLA2_60105 [Burkholderia gladioli]